MDFLKEIFSKFSNDRCPSNAAALAYYTAFALPPLLYLLLTVLTLTLSVAYDNEEAEEKAQAVIERQTAQMLGNQSVSQEITRIMENNKAAGGQWWKTLISFGGILLGATGVVVALQDSLNHVWQVKPDPETNGFKNMLGKRILSFAMILGLGFVLLVSLIVSSILTAAGETIGGMIGMQSIVINAINYLVQAAVVFVTFAAIYKFMPDADVHWQDVLVGALATMILFLIGQYAMQLFFTYSSPGAGLGSAVASFAVILVWVYYSGLILLLGAEATQVYATRYGAGIHPEKGAVHVVEEIKRPD